MTQVVKYESQKAGRRVNFYVRDGVEVERDFVRLASMMHQEGALGVYSSSGEPNKSAILQRLIDEKLGRIPANLGDSID